jgi:DNA-binding protein HU-beta
MRLFDVLKVMRNKSATNGDAQTQAAEELERATSSATSARPEVSTDAVETPRTAASLPETPAPEPSIGAEEVAVEEEVPTRASGAGRPSANRGRKVPSATKATTTVGARRSATDPATPPARTRRTTATKAASATGAGASKASATKAAAGARGKAWAAPAQGGTRKAGATKAASATGARKATAKRSPGSVTTASQPASTKAAGRRKG